ncbi:MAG: preprotein translocase subunit SecE [bacterium]|nr:preprotein translocase subunit SecE [bacterium]
MLKAVTFLKEVWEEIGKVTWPTREEAIKMTLTVIIASTLIAIFIGGLDFLLTSLVGKILNL